MSTERANKWNQNGIDCKISDKIAKFAILFGRIKNSWVACFFSAVECRSSSTYINKSQRLNLHFELFFYEPFPNKLVSNRFQLVFFAEKKKKNIKFVFFFRISYANVLNFHSPKRFRCRFFCECFRCSVIGVVMSFRCYFRPIPMSFFLFWRSFFNICHSNQI